MLENLCLVNLPPNNDQSFPNKKKMITRKLGTSEWKEHWNQ